MTFKPKKIVTALNKTRAGTRALDKIKSSTFLPGVFQSSLNEKWLNASLDLMISKGDLDDINAYVGAATGQELNDVNDLYLNTNQLTHMQPTIVAKDASGEMTESISWDQIKDRIELEFNDYDYNAAYNTRSYMFNPPINVDKFINFSQYYWCPEILDAPAIITLTNTTYTNYNPIDVFNNVINGQLPYEIVDGPTVTESGTIELYNGMVVQFIGAGFDPAITNHTYVICGVGKKIKFRSESNISRLTPFTKFYSGVQVPWEDKSYTVCNINDDFVSGFSRANRWMHINALRLLAKADPSIPLLEWSNNTKNAKRNIIEFDRNLLLWDIASGTHHNVVHWQVGLEHLSDISPLGPILNVGSWVAGEKVIIKTTNAIQESYNTIYTIDVDGISLTPSTTLADGDYWTIGHDYYSGDQADYSRYDFQWKDDVITLIQTMVTPSTRPLFRLKDYQANWLDSYSESTFNGNYIFGYKTGTGAVDTELGFAPSYKDIGTTSEVEFTNYIDSERYYTQEYQNNVEVEILGNYFYDFTGGKSFNNYIPSTVPVGAKTKLQIISGPDIPSAPITGATGNGQTIVFLADNNFKVGWTIDITGMAPNQYNLMNATIVAATETTFTINSGVTGAFVSGGTAALNENTNLEWALKQISETDTTKTDITIDLPLSEWRPALHYEYFERNGEPALLEVTNNKIYNESIRTPLTVEQNTTIDFYDVSADQSLQFLQVDPTDPSGTSFITAGTSHDGKVTIAITDNKHSVTVADEDNYVLWYTNGTNRKVRIITASHEKYAQQHLHITINGQQINYSDYSATSTGITISGSTLDASENHIIDIEYYRNTPDIETTVPESIANNPTNEKLTDFTIGETFNHWISLIQHQPGFDGVAYGNNNYDYIPKTNTLGGTIYITDSSPIIHDYTYANKNLDLTEGIKNQAKEWYAFRNRLVAQAKRMYSSNSTLDIKSLTNLIISQLTENNKGKELHRKSNMAFGKLACDQVIIYDAIGGEYGIDVNINADVYVKDHINVYIEDNHYSNNTRVFRLLKENSDYTIASGLIKVTTSKTDFTNGEDVTLHIYKHNALDDCYIPASLAKLGLDTVIEPNIFNNGTTHIICHDGYYHDTGIENVNISDPSNPKFDAASAVLYELELRIWNNISRTSTVSHSHFMPTISQGTWFTRHTIDDYIERFFKEWQKNTGNTELNIENYYDALDPFTWNYSTLVAPGKLNDNYPGHWRGAYALLFATDRPEIAPWEMLGFGEEPIWWSTHYHWTNTTKRANLINALTYGIISEPGEPIIQNPKYARIDWDWATKAPVNILGEIVSPDIVLGTPPAVDAAQLFVFGDVGPTEYEWRQTPLGAAAILDAVMKLNPCNTWLQVFQPGESDYFSSTDGSVVNKNTETQFSNTNMAFHGESIGKQIKNVEIISTNDTVVPAATTVVFVGGTTHEDTAKAELNIHSGVLTSVELTRRGSGYTGLPNIILVFPTGYAPPAGQEWPQAQFDIEFEDDYEFFKGIDQIMHNNKLRSRADFDRSQRLASLETHLMQPLAGFTDKSLITVKSESSANGAYTLGSNDYTINMHGGLTEQLITASSVKFKKVSNGFVIDGYSRHRQEFVFYEPYGVEFDLVELSNGLTVQKFKHFAKTPSILKFDTKLTRIQDVYNFIRGYAHYLESMGFSLQVSGEGIANEAVTWANQAGVDTTYISEIGQVVSFSSTEYSILPFGSLPGNINSIIGVDKNGNEVDVTIDNLCITRLNDTVTIHPSSINPKSTESNETIVNVTSASNLASTSGILTTDDYGNTIYRPAELPQTQLSNSEWNADVETNTVDVIRSVTVGLTRYYHGILFNNKTTFNEVIFDTVLGSQQKRLQLFGQRTRDWQGRKDAPGYLINDTSIVQNFDTLAADMNDLYDFNTTKFNDDVARLERMTLGITATNWIKNIDLPENVVNKFMQGVLKNKGTNSVVDKFNRSSVINQGQSDVDVTEYWMFNSSNFGDTVRNKSTEIKIKSTQVTDNPSIIDLADLSLDYVNKEIDTEFNMVPFDQLGITQRKAGDLKIDEYDYIASTMDSFAEIYNSTADYATIPTWSGSRSWKFNDLIRKDGILYKCAVDYIGYNELADYIIAQGVLDISSVSFPYAASPSPASATIDGIDIWFDKTVTTYPDIVATGTELNPSWTGDKQLIVDGSIVIDLTKEETVEEVDTGAAYGGVPVTTQITDHDSAVDVTGLVLSINSVSVDLQAAGAKPSADENEVVTGTGAATYTLVGPAEPMDTMHEITATYPPIGNTGGPYTEYVDSLAGTITFTPALVAGDTVTVNYIKPYYISRTQLKAAINGNGSLTALSIAAVDHESNPARIAITRTTGVDPTNPGSYDPLTIDTASGNSAMALVAGTYNVTTHWVVQDALQDLPYIEGQIAAALPSATYSVGTSANSIQITKLASSGLGASSELTFGGTAQVLLGLLSTYAIGSSWEQPTDSTAAEVVADINLAMIPGVTAQVVTNRIVIQKDSGVDVQMDIGDTSFNSLAGLPIGILGVSDNTSNSFDPMKWTNISSEDTALFNAWILNDSKMERKAINNITASFSSWNVLQSQRIPAWAAIDAGDISSDGNDAKISLFNSSNDAYSRSAVNVGDYVMLLNTTSTPTISGIHKVTALEPTDINSFYIDRFIETDGRAEAVFVFRNARFNTYADMISAMAIANSDYNFATGDRIWVTESADPTPTPGTYSYLYNGDGTVTLNRSTTTYVDNSVLENIRLYDAAKQKTVIELELFDPLQGIIPGVADREIDFKYPVDIAVYNMSNDTNYNTNQRNAWTNDQVGKIWWDTSTVFYIDYKQGDANYAANNWGKQADTSSVDIYEWTKSTVTPDKWENEVAAGNDHYGTIASGEAYRIYDEATSEYIDYYTEDTVWNDHFSRYDTVYYFWVANKNTITSTDKTLATINIAAIINDPTSSGIPWAAAISQYKFIMNNIAYYVNDVNSVIQVNVKPDLASHSSWTAISEVSDLIPDYYYIGLQDNLVGTQRITNNPLPDKTLHEFNRYGDNRSIQYKYPGVKHSQAWFKDTLDARREAVDIINRLLIHQNIVDNLDGKWDQTLTKIYYDVPADAETGTSAEFELYKTTNWDPINNNLQGESFYNTETETLYRCTGSEWVQDSGWDMNLVWHYADYITQAFAANEVSATASVATYNDLLNIDTSKHSVVIVGPSTVCTSTNLQKEATYQWSGTGWNLVKKKNATIQFNDLIWNQNNLFAWDMQSWDGIWDHDPSGYVHYIIEACRNDLFIDSYLENFNNFFFGIVRYIANLHTQVDWFYKTTFIKLNIDTTINTSNQSHRLPKRLYKNNVDIFEGFINEVKPFHTKIKTVFDKYRVLDVAEINVTEESVNKFIEIKYEDEINDEFGPDVETYSSTFTSTPPILDGGDFTSTPVDSINGGGFDIPANYNITSGVARRSTYNGIIDESASFKVITNSSGATVDNDSRTYVYVIGQDHRLAAFGLEDAKATTVSADTLRTATTIEVTDPSVFRAHGGMAFINGEVISYLGVTGNQIEGVMHSNGETINGSHASGTQIIDISDTSVLQPFDSSSEFAMHNELPWLDFNDYVTMATSRMFDVGTGDSLVDPAATSNEALVMKNQGKGIAI